MTHHAGLAESPDPAASQKSSSKTAWPKFWEILLLLLIVLAAIGLRAAYLYEIKSNPEFDVHNKDAVLYNHWAHGLATGDWTLPESLPDPHIQSSPFFRPPAYPYFMAGIYKTFGADPNNIRIAQMVLGILSSILMFFLARALFGTAAGLAGALFMAVYWSLLYAEAELNTPTLIVFLFLLLLTFLRFWISRMGIIRALIPGLIIGLMALLRYEMILLVPLILLWGLWISKGHRIRAIVCLIAFMLGTTAVIAPVTARNYLVSNKFIPIAATGGMDLYAANNPQADGISPIINLKETLGLAKQFDPNDLPLYCEALKTKLGLENVSYYNLSNHFALLAFQYMHDNPRQTLERIGKKALLFWGPDEVANTCVPFYHKLTSITLRYMPGFAVIAALFLLGVLLFVTGSLKKETGTNQSRLTLLILAMILLLFLAYLPFFAAAQFRIGITPLLLLFAAGAVQGLINFTQRKQPIRLLAAVAVGVLLFFAARIELVTAPQDLSKWHFDRGLALEREGLVPDAMIEYEKSINAGYQPDARTNLGGLLATIGKYEEAENLFADELKQDPGNPRAEFQWARALAMQKNPKEAVDHLQEAVSKDPGFADAYNLMAIQFTRLNDYHSAIKRFRDAIRLAPQNPLYVANLADALMYVGDSGEALQRYAEAVQIAPTDGILENAWGNALASMDRLDEALPHFQAAIQKNPKLVEAYNSIGYLLTQKGQTEDALKYYNNAIEVNPNFTLVHNNMGNLLTDMGRFEEAMPHFQKALEVNPNDPFAEFNWGRSLSLKGDSNAAVEHFRKAIEKRPDYAAAHNFLGYDLYRLGRLQEAEASYRTAIQLAPRFILPHNNLGQLYLDQGQYEAAYAQFQAAMEINPQDPFPANGLKIIREKLGAAQAPPTETPAPPMETPAPPAPETPAPPAETPTPPAETPAPPAPETPAPPAETPAPQVETPAPAPTPETPANSPEAK